MAKKMMDEGDVKAHVKEALNLFRPRLHWWMPPAGAYGVSGQHDFMVCQRGYMWSIETKFGSRMPTPNQRKFGGKVKRAGGFCLLVNDTNIVEVARIAGFVDTGHIELARKWADMLFNWDGSECDAT